MSLTTKTQHIKMLDEGSISCCLWLSTAILFLLVTALAGCQSTLKERSVDAYVGTWTSGRGEGIYLFQFDGNTGVLSSPRAVVRTTNPSYVTVSPSGRHLYSVNHTADAASVSAFEVDTSTGELALLNEVPAEGGSPCFISIDASGQWVLVANYVGGNVVVFPVREDGSLGTAAAVVQHRGASVDPERQAAPHPHYFAVGPENRFAVTSDLGIDKLRIYPFDADRGRIDEQDVRET